MKKCKFKDYRSFSHSGEAWYTQSVGFSPGVVDEVFFGLSCGGGGTHGEMKMEFRELSGKIVPQLQVFDDGWEVLASFTDLALEMAKLDTNDRSWKEPSITPKQFCELLLRCGFKDQTLRNPNPVPVEVPVVGPTNRQLLNLAQAHLKSDIQTLSARNSDRLDFHEVSVWGIDCALRAAYELGWKAAKG